MGSYTASDTYGKVFTLTSLQIMFQLKVDIIMA